MAATIAIHDEQVDGLDPFGRRPHTGRVSDQAAWISVQRLHRHPDLAKPVCWILVTSGPDGEHRACLRRHQRYATLPSAREIDQAGLSETDSSARRTGRSTDAYPCADSPNWRSFLRSVPRVMPRITAAWVWLPSA